VPSYPPCSAHGRLGHPVTQLEGPLAELLRVAHRLGVPLVVWSGSWSGTPDGPGPPGRLLAHTHVCSACDPSLTELIRTIESTIRDGLLHSGALQYAEGPKD
jgi:hypothetical protein